MTHQIREIGDLAIELLAHIIGFFNNGGILLRHLIHLAHGQIDLLQAGRLLTRAQCNGSDHIIDRAHLFQNARHHFTRASNGRDAIAHIRLRAFDQAFDLFGSCG